MMSQILSPKWHIFQNALAGILKMSFAVVFPPGKLQRVYNPQPPFTLFDSYPLLAEAYRAFYLKISQIYDPAAPEQISEDPLGLPTAVISLEDEAFLILGGCLTKRDAGVLANLHNRLQEMGVPGETRPWLQMTFLSEDELRVSCQHVKTIYRQLDCTFHETTGLGQRMLLLAAVEEINKLMVKLLSPGKFDLSSILDLVVSSLVILFDAEGAWAFVYQRPAKTMSKYRGKCNKIIESLQREWQAGAAGQADPLNSFIPLCKEKIPAGISVALETLQLRDASCCLGVITANNPEVSSALAAFARQVAIALEVASLYESVKQRLDVLYNAVLHGLIMTNRDGTVLLVNEIAQDLLAGRGVKLTLGEPLRGTGFYRPMEEALEDVTKSGCAYIHKRALIGSGDHPLHLRWDALPLVSGKGDITGALLLIEDITEQVNLFQEIRDWERLATAGEVAAGLAHEIRNPLATAKAAIQLYDIINNDSKRKELMVKLNSELERMNDIISTFLNTSKPIKEEGLKPISPVGVMRELEFLLRGEANLNEIDLVVNLPDQGVPPVMGDPNNLKQVFLNIARNAIEAMPQGGRLQIDLQCLNGDIHIRFHDNGPGIPEEILRNITRPFFTTKLGGTGLGLSISSSIVKMMGGDILIKSRPGGGTMVDIIMPCCNTSCPDQKGVIL
ncbi:MAG: ATP-binding protein [Bacillota bacterium]